jgi:undecaprenyl-diphosphatase
MINDWIKALLISILEGLTEFIPVSSTGHLVLFSRYLEFNGERADTFSIFIQLGAILAVVVLYKQRFFDLLKNGSGFKGIVALQKLFIAAVPACILGALFYSKIKKVLFAPMPVAIALIIGGIFLLMFDKKSKYTSDATLDDLSYRQAIGVGIAQCFSLIPGVSRSGSTIIGGLICGLSKQVAAEFSFILAVPVMCAAVLYDLYKSLNFLVLADIPIFVFGFVVAFITALFAIKFFIQLLNKIGLWPFGVYRIILGLVVLILL